MSESQPLLFDMTPPKVLPRADGSVLVLPGRPILRQERITVQEAMRLLGKSKASIYRYINEGHLTASQQVRRGRLLLIRAEVDALAGRARDDG